jgi:hypothetical protein
MTRVSPATTRKRRAATSPLTTKGFAAVTVMRRPWLLASVTNTARSVYTLTRSVHMTKPIPLDAQIANQFLYQLNECVWCTLAFYVCAQCDKRFGQYVSWAAICPNCDYGSRTLQRRPGGVLLATCHYSTITADPNGGPSLSLGPCADGCEWQLRYWHG